MTHRANAGTRFDPAVVAVRMLDKFPTSAHRRALGLSAGYPKEDPLRVYWETVAEEISVRGIAVYLAKGVRT